MKDSDSASLKLVKELLLIAPSSEDLGADLATGTAPSCIAGMLGHGL